MNLRAFSEFKDAARAFDALKAAGRLRGVSRAGASTTAAVEEPRRPQPPPSLEPPSPAARPTTRPPAARSAEPQPAPLPQRPPAGDAPLLSPPKVQESSQPNVAAPSPVTEVSAPEQAGAEPSFLSVRITNILEAVCRRGGFSGALIADESGLPIAEYNCDAELVAACASVLGGAIEQTGRILGRHDANNITLDINHVEKLALRSFSIGTDNLYLLVQCPQTIDERGQVELALKQIIQCFVLQRSGPDSARETSPTPALNL